MPFTRDGLLNLLTSPNVDEFHYIYKSNDLGKFLLDATNNRATNNKNIEKFYNDAVVLVFENGEIEADDENCNKVLVLRELDYLSPKKNPAFADLMRKLGTKHGKFYRDNTSGDLMRKFSRNRGKIYGDNTGGGRSVRKTFRKRRPKTFRKRRQ
jgi:hypothetical protein